MRFALLTAFLATPLYAQNFVGQVRMRPFLPPITQPAAPPSPVKLTQPPFSTCAVPLLNVRPRNASPDSAMIIRPGVTSRMPVVVPPAPPCKP